MSPCPVAERRTPVAVSVATSVGGEEYARHRLYRTGQRTAHDRAMVIEDHSRHDRAMELSASGYVLPAASVDNHETAPGKIIWWIAPCARRPQRHRTRLKEAFSRSDVVKAPFSVSGVPAPVGIT